MYDDSGRKMWVSGILSTEEFGRKSAGIRDICGRFLSQKIISPKKGGKK
jgi:hypothetical protein